MSLFFLSCYSLEKKQQYNLTTCCNILFHLATSPPWESELCKASIWLFQQNKNVLQVCGSAYPCRGANLILWRTIKQAACLKCKSHRSSCGGAEGGRPIQFADNRKEGIKTETDELNIWCQENLGDVWCTNGQLLIISS